MDLNAKTKIDDLLKEYPFLMDFFLNKSPKFQHLKNPVMRKTIGKVATLKQVATVGNIDLDELIGEIADEIREKTNDEVTICGGSSQKASEILSDPKARQETLKAIIKDLHKGENKVKKRLDMPGLRLLPNGYRRLKGKKSGPSTQKGLVLT